MRLRHSAAGIATILVVFPTLGLTLPRPEAPASPGACELVDLAMAVQVIGPDAQMIGDDSDPDSCMYMVPGKAVLTVLLANAEYYDQVSLGGPHTPAAIGDRARRSTNTAESVTVGFVKGDYSVSITASNVASAKASFLDPLLAAARVAADRLP